MNRRKQREQRGNELRRDVEFLPTDVPVGSLMGDPGQSLFPLCSPVQLDGLILFGPQKAHYFFE
jgi:hypothetical protein